MICFSILLKALERMTDPQFIPEKEKFFFVKRLGENVSQLTFCVNVFYAYRTLLYIVSQKMMSEFNVL